MTTLKSYELVPISGDDYQNAYAAALAESGRKFTPMSAAYIPSPGWDYNAGGEGNQQDDPLRHYLAWLWYGDEYALSSGFAILEHLAANLTGTKHTYQNGHGQRHPNFGLYALLALERGDIAQSKRMIEAEIKLYSLNLASKEWASIGPTTFRPGCRFVSTTSRLCHDVPKLIDAGLIHPDQFPGEFAPSAVLARLVTWAAKWFWKMRGPEGGEGWTVTPGLMRYDSNETDWLYWSQSTSASIETNDTAFMQYSIFPRDLAIAMTWLRDLIASGTYNLWTDRLRDMATWALAVAYDPATGLAKRAQDWSPDILTARGPFHTYASPDTGERTHSLAVTFAAARAPREKRKDQLMNWLRMGGKLAPGEVDEGLVIAANQLGFGQ